MLKIKHFLKSLQHHGVITKQSETSEIKKYKTESDFSIMHNSANITEISYDRTMPEFLWIVSNNSWKQLDIPLLHYKDFQIYEKMEIF
jgi:hypothetical protein